MIQLYSGILAYSYVVNVDNPESSTESVVADASVMSLAYKTWQECLVN